MSITRDFYMARAADAARDAEAALLTNVRERCLRAEAAWLSMADRLDRTEVARERNVAEKAAREGVKA